MKGIRYPAEFKAEVIKQITEERDILKKATVSSTGQCNTI